MGKGYILGFIIFLIVVGAYDLTAQTSNIKKFKNPPLIFRFNSNVSGLFLIRTDSMSNYTLPVTTNILSIRDKDSTIFIIKANGDILLRGKVIGTDSTVSKILRSLYSR